MIPTNKKTDHLILLVGSNPLPNYVAGRLLLNEGGTIHLVHSEDTKRIAKVQLKKKFGKKRCKLYSLGYEQSNSKMVYDTIQEILTHEIPEDVKVGLNYTGGTKTMSVHAYEAAKGSNVVMSYIDGVTGNIIVDGEVCTSLTSITIAGIEEYLDCLVEELELPKNVTITIKNNIVIVTVIAQTALQIFEASALASRLGGDMAATVVVNDTDNYLVDDCRQYLNDKIVVETKADNVKWGYDVVANLIKNGKRQQGGRNQSDPHNTRLSRITFGD